MGGTRQARNLRQGRRVPPVELSKKAQNMKKLKMTVNETFTHHKNAKTIYKTENLNSSRTPVVANVLR